MFGVCSSSRHRLSATPADRGIAECGGLALDVMGGTEQLFVRLLGKARRLTSWRAASSRSHSVCIQSPNSLDSSASAASARATGSSSPSSAGVDGLAQRDAAA